MNPKYELHEQIDRYLKHELSAEELVQFNKALLTDEEFKMVFEAQQEAHELIVDKELIKLKERMSKDLSGKDGNDPYNWGKTILLSAAIGGTAVFSILYYSNYNSTPDTTQKEQTVSKTNVSFTEKVSENKERATPGTENTNLTKTSTKASNQTSASLIVAPTDNTIPKHTPIKEDEPIRTTLLKEIVESIPETKIPTQENKKTIVKCETVVITADVKVEYLNDEATIRIDGASVRGGTAPYLYSLDKQSFGADSGFETTKDGTYHAYIKDQNNCISEIKKEIQVKIPQKEIDEAFSPSSGELWAFPLKNGADGTLTILNKAGLTVYSAAIHGGYPKDWDGRDANGTELSAGNYYFMIQYTNNELLKGRISIVR